MVAGISITCFAASYAVALALEASRLWFRSGVRSMVMLGFAGAGVFAHTLFLAYRATTTASTPLSSEFDWYLIAALTLAVVYLHLLYYYPRTPIGLLVLPLVLGLIGLAEFTAAQVPFPESRAAQVWGMIHGVFLLAGTVAVITGFIAGVAYLWQAYRLKQKLPPMPRVQLPSLELLERANSQAMVLSVIMLSLGFLSGVVLNLVMHRRNLDQLPWSDPVVWTFGLLLLWLTAVTLFTALYRPARKGRKVAYLTVASLLFLALFFGARALLPSEHGVKPSAEKSLQAALPIGEVHG